MRRLLIATMAFAAFALPAGALASTATATAGAQTATLQYSGSFPTQHDLRLSITEHGHVLYRRPISSRYCGHDCQVAPLPGTAPVRFVQLAGSTSDVLVNLNSGGAHCCSIAQVFRPRAGGHGYAKLIEHNFGDPGYRLATLSGTGARQFVTADDAFAYAFTDFAASGLPIQILALQSGSFADVTGHYPGLVRRDAGRWLTAYHRQASSGYSDSVGVIAAWAADEYTLHRGAHARAYLNAQARAGHLRSALSPMQTGTAFVVKLERFLSAHGYTR